MHETTWKDVVKQALEDLGGTGHLRDINARIEGHWKTKTNPTWKATIRKVVRQYKVFEAVPSNRGGLYRLADVLPENEPIPPSQFVGTTIDHGSAQGMLVVIGKVYGYETFVPKHDQTARQFDGVKLGDLVTVRDCPSTFSQRNLSAAREIDVLWLDEDDEGPYPIYAFEVEGTTGVKSGLDRLLKIPHRFTTALHVLGPSDKEKDLFSNFMAQSPFRQYRNRFRFHYYSDLLCLYTSAVEHCNRRDDFGVRERYATTPAMPSS